MTRPLRNVSASVKARLLALARSAGEEFQSVLRRYAIERLLYRLSRSVHADRFVLKGAMLYAVWGGPVSRSTKDLDLLGHGENNPEAVASWFRAVAETPVPDDGIEFLADSVRAEPIAEEKQYAGVRAKLTARIGTARFPVQVDVGFGDAITPGAVEIDFPVLLDGPAPRLRAYPMPTVVAEKAHAIVILGPTNSRLKDFYDLYVLARGFAFDGGVLGGAIRATFARRATELPASLPAGLAPEFFAGTGRAALWRAYLTKSGLEGVPADFVAVGEALRAFLAPLLSAGGAPAPRSWPAGGPWR